jgi:hypothetical protein
MVMKSAITGLSIQSKHSIFAMMVREKPLAVQKIPQIHLFNELDEDHVGHLDHVDTAVSRHDLLP